VVLGKLFQRVEHHGAGMNVHAGLNFDPGQDLDGKERMAAYFKEIVPQTHRIDVEFLFPNIGEVGLVRREDLGRSCFLVAPRSLGKSRRFLSIFPAGVSGMRSSSKKWCGSM